MDEEKGYSVYMLLASGVLLKDVTISAQEADWVSQYDVGEIPLDRNGEEVPILHFLIEINDFLLFLSETEELEDEEEENEDLGEFEGREWDLN